MKPGRKSAGHPVDIASGTVFRTIEDISVIGKIDLVWERRYSTTLLEGRTTPLGPGWTNRYFAALEKGPEAYRFTTPEGDVERFEDPEGLVESGGTVRNPGSFQELSRTGDQYVVTRWDIDTGEVVRFIFVRGGSGEARPLERIEDVTGQALEMLRDGSGRLAGVRQRLERRTLEIAYEADRIASVSLVGADGTREALTRYEHDARGRLVAAHDARGFVDRYEYDDEGRIAREVLKDGGVFTFAYDGDGRCVHTSGAEGYDEKTFSYRSHIGWTEVTNSRGHTRRYQWLPTGQVVTEIDPLGGVEQTEYDEHGRIVSRTNPLGAKEEYEYDDRGNRSAITNPVGHTTRIAYDDSHQIVEIVNPAGDTSRRIYDERNRMVASEDFEGNRYELSYDEDGNLVSVVDPLERELRQDFDARGARRTLTDWEGNVTRFRADHRGRVTEIVDPLGHRKRLHYDAMSNLTRVDYPDGTTNEFEYDAGGNLVRVDDRRGDVTRYRFAPCRRLIERIDPAGNTVSFAWGTEPGNLNAVTNAEGDVYAFAYDAAGRVSGETGFDGREIRFEYDRAGNRVASINGRGERIEYERDVGGRLLREILPDGGETVYSYDAAGFVEAVRNPDAEIRFERDAMGRIVREVQNGHAIEREFDPTGMVVGLASDLAPGLEFGFDGNCLLSRVEVEGHGAMVLDRDGRGSEVRRRLPGGTTVRSDRDEMGRLAKQEVSARTRTFERTYRFGKTQLASVRDGSAVTTYEYDPLRRVVRAMRDRGASERFSYDGDDNIARLERGDDVRSLRYGPGDRLQAAGDTEYEYDRQGRLIRKTEPGPEGGTREWRYTWDAKDQLRSVTNPAGETWRYTYDPFGRRVEKLAPDGTAHAFVWDVDHPLHELRDGEVSSTWIFDPHSLTPLGKLEGGELYSVVTDHLGTPREMIDRSGEVVWEADHLVWGRTTGEEGGETGCPVRFQGQWHDAESGLHYNRYRYYDPDVGRFISPDPTRLMGAMNLYAYVFDPNMWVDPLGLVVNTTADRTHITYVGSKGGKPYVGYASTPGDRTGSQVLSNRYSSGFMAEGLDGTPRVVYRGYGQDLDSSRAAKAAARGLEQRHFEQLGGLEGTANRQNPVGRNNANRDTYLEAADEELGRQQDPEDGCGG